MSKRRMNPNSLANLRGFEPGFDARRNLGGRPRSPMTAALIKLLEQPFEDDPTMTWLQAIALSLVRAAAKGDTRAAEAVADRIEGRPAQQIGLRFSAPYGQVLNLDSFRGLTPEQLEKEFQDAMEVIKRNTPRGVQ